MEFPWHFTADFQDESPPARNSRYNRGQEARGVPTPRKSAHSPHLWRRIMLHQSIKRLHAAFEVRNGPPGTLSDRFWSGIPPSLQTKASKASVDTLYIPNKQHFMRLCFVELSSASPIFRYRTTQPLEWSIFGPECWGHSLGARCPVLFPKSYVTRIKTLTV